MDIFFPIVVYVVPPFLPLFYWILVLKTASRLSTRVGVYSLMVAVTSMLVAGNQIGGPRAQVVLLYASAALVVGNLLYVVEREGSSRARKWITFGVLGLLGGGGIYLALKFLRS